MFSQKVLFLVIGGKNLTDECIGNFFLTDAFASIASARIRPWTSYPIDGALGGSGGGRVRKLSVVCLHNNAIVAGCTLVTILQCATPEPRLSPIYNVSMFEPHSIFTVANVKKVPFFLFKINVPGMLTLFTFKAFTTFKKQQQNNNNKNI